jgi:hypothetical protein
LFVFKARQQAHNGLCNCWRNEEDDQKGKPVWYINFWKFPKLPIG